MWVKWTVKWIGFALLGYAGLVVIAVILVYIVMGRDLARTYDIESEVVAVPSDSASIDEGQRLAQLRGFPEVVTAKPRAAG